MKTSLQFFVWVSLGISIGSFFILMIFILLQKTDSVPTTIAVVDTAVSDEILQEFRGRITVVPVAKKARKPIPNSQSHGSKISKILLNENPNLKVLLFPAFSELGNLDESLFEHALNQILKNEDIRILLMAFGIQGGNSAQRWSAKITELTSKGILIVAPAGHGLNGLQPEPTQNFFPQNHPSVFLISNLEYWHGFLSTVPTENYGPEIDVGVVAPFDGRYLKNDKSSASSSYAAAYFVSHIANKISHWKSTQFNLRRQSLAYLPQNKYLDLQSGHPQLGFGYFDFAKSLGQSQTHKTPSATKTSRGTSKDSPFHIDCRVYLDPHSAKPIDLLSAEEIRRRDQREIHPTWPPKLKSKQKYQHQPKHRWFEISVDHSIFAIKKLIHCPKKDPLIVDLSLPDQYAASKGLWQGEDQNDLNCEIGFQLRLQNLSSRSDVTISARDCLAQ